eukprot:6692867-Lingulodinium_polyedra.AAC.1
MASATRGLSAFLRTPRTTRWHCFAIKRRPLRWSKRVRPTRFPGTWASARSLAGITLRVTPTGVRRICGSLP